LRGARGWSRRRRIAIVLGAIYLALLSASHLTRFVRDVRHPGVAPDPLGPEAHAIELTEIGGAEPSRRVRVVYEDHGPGSGAPVLLCLHGSPGSRADFRRLEPLLSDRLRVLTLDLPGFGDSERVLADYGIDSHARYALELLDRLAIDRAHLLGYSMGGGVALELAELLGPRLDSLTMLSATGVQELELLGDHHLNHAVHGLQLSLFWIALEALPHFGAFDGGFFSRAYARNFYDSDQRPLRGILERLEAPLSVIHAPGDPLVPIEAAREHARLVPWSELTELDLDMRGSGIRAHLLPQLEAERVASVVADFVERVSLGLAGDPSQADPDRLMAAAAPFEPVPIRGMGLLVAILLIAAATLISEDLTCIATGALVAQGRIDLTAGAFACFVGIYVGDLALFLSGRLFGARALRVPPLSWMLDDGVVERAARWFDRRGLSAIFLTRFMPGTRLPTYFAAGALRTNALSFALYFAIAAGVWTPILVWLSSLIGDNLQENVALFERALPLGLLATIAVGLAVVKLIVPMFTWRGRRRLVGSWERRVHWEFWPPWAFYPPVVLFVLWRGLRSGALATFCASNPGIRHGGFVGESKAEILRALGGASDAVPRWVLIPGSLDPEARIEELERFVREDLDGQLPVVLKPDAGQRGSGVVVARDLERARAYLADTDLDLIAQAWVGGPEFGVFYARRPGEVVGQVSSVTVKRPAVVVGDGRRTLEELILRDRRAVAIASTYLARNADRLDLVPAAGERVEISNLGTHALGAVFEDGAELITPELEAAIDALAKHFDGFHFGRFDLRAPDQDALREGRGLSIIELNGVTAEMTHIYDRRHSVWYGWRTVIRQWALAFEIGAANRERGVRVPGLFELLLELWRYRRGQRQHRA
jgi:membrane protein DedA with SNARE-associated domain/pimeloyl-ACP methyl ester carboxylesterase